MDDEKQVREAQMAYLAHAVDLSRPVVLERDGQPMAAILPYQDYKEFLDWREHRQPTAWQKLNRLLAQVHSQPTDMTPEQIEAEITIARKVRETHREHQLDFTARI